MLFACVPTPSTSEPVAQRAPPAGTTGSMTIAPLLSCGRRATGFWTCWERAAVAPPQAEPEQEKYIPFAGLFTHPVPQSSAKTPTPRMPLKPAVAGLCSAPGQIVDVKAVEMFAKPASITWRGTVTVGSLASVTPATWTGP